MGGFACAVIDRGGAVRGWGVARASLSGIAQPCISRNVWDACRRKVYRPGCGNARLIRSLHERCRFWDKVSALAGIFNSLRYKVLSKSQAAVFTDNEQIRPLYVEGRNKSRRAFPPYIAAQRQNKFGSAL